VACDSTSGFPRPEAQIEFFEDGVCKHRLDLSYRKRRKAAEYDGEANHSTAVHREYDERRRLWFDARGWEILSVGKGRCTGPVGRSSSRSASCSGSRRGSADQSPAGDNSRNCMITGGQRGR